MPEAKDVNTKTALLRAAMEVFADKGFDSATVRDICGRAKANVAAVNYHYGSKDGLYAAVLEVIFPKEKAWKVPHAPELPPRERLHAFLRGLAGEIFESNNGMVGQKWSIFLREMAKPSHNLDFIVKQQIQPQAEELRDIIRSCLGPSTSEHLLAFASSNIWALMLDHLLIQPIQDRLIPHRAVITDDIDQLVELVLDFSMGGLEALKKR